jgi:hypothetical protein
LTITGDAILEFAAASVRGRQLRTIPASFDLTNKSRNNLVELTTGGTGDFELAVTLGAAKSSGARITDSWSVASVVVIGIGGLLV